MAAYTVINKNKRPLEEEGGEEKEMPCLKEARKVWKEEEQAILIEHFG